MKLTAKLKLELDLEQQQLLLNTIRETNILCNRISQLAFKERKFGKSSLQKEFYHKLRKKYPQLSSQIFIRSFAKVAAAYKNNKRTLVKFRFNGSIAYDARLLSWMEDDDKISVWTLNGRQPIRFVCGEHQQNMLGGKIGESKLLLRKNKFYLHVSVEVKESEGFESQGYLGVDLGLAQIAYDSDATAFSGEQIRAVRKKNVHRRRQLQKKGTKSCKRKLKERSGREARFRNDVNHVLSKAIVKKAQRTKRTIVLEDLSGIRNRVRASRELRRELHSWAFYDLRKKIEYKAKRDGVEVLFVDAAYTSQTCSQCGYCDKRNRKSQSVFVCRECGTQSHADLNAARNIAEKGRQLVIKRERALFECEDDGRVAVNQPNGGVVVSEANDEASSVVQLKLF
ncbi:MAG: transposase [Deltaproteobacteria bacterium]|nr:transposase [Deltaproteobacteria bacterium]MBU50517.1 transposase [Deltaproteobacteria bacterium]|tara:strand:+ start:1501 stop:2691 length:1191 start_codon:yes stop_codon:yes gene_type:complete